jgi:prepilin-type N-terminal cleavage/methylation domain-containing protein
VKRISVRPVNRARWVCGFTIIEMMIGAVIFAAVSSAALKFYQGQHGQLIQQTDVTDTQQNLRATMDELTRQIRQAGYRTYGTNAVVVLNSNTWLAVQYHNGDSVVAQLFFPFINSLTGRTDLMTQLGTNPMQIFAEGIDSVRFTPGGTGGGIEWVTIDLVAKTASEGFQTPSSDGQTGSNKHLYRRLSSVVRLRNR